MPMQHRHIAKRRQRRLSTFGGQLQRRPADFLSGPRRHAGAERRRHHLRAEANAERRLAGIEPRFDRGNFVDDKRI